MRKIYYFYILFLFATISWTPLVLNSVQNGQTPISSVQAVNSDQELVGYFRNLFENDWDLGVNYIYDPLEEMAQQSFALAGSSYTPFDSEHIQDNMSITPIFSPDNSEPLIISLIESATSKLYIEQMYIYYEPEISDIIQSIIDAYSRGVEVKVIVGEGNDESGETAENLTSYGIPVRISVEKADNGNYFNIMHNKGVISDDSVLISSINWSPTSIFDNREAGLIIDSSLIADYFEMLFDYDWIASEVYNSSAHFDSVSIPHPSSGNPFLNPNPYTPQYSTPRTFTGEYNIEVMASPDNCFDIVKDALLNAQESIYISVYTLSSPYLLEVLRDRVAAGLDVRILLEQQQFSVYEKRYNRHTMYNLTTMGVSGNFAQGRWAAADSEFVYQHCKYAIIDNETLLISSGNWSRSSCPKPQADGDVDGNRDWWIKINNEISSESPINLREIFLFYILPGTIVAALAGIIFLITKNKKALYSVV